MRFLRIILLFAFGGIIGFAAGRFVPNEDSSLISPVLPSPTPKPLLKYSFTNLATYTPRASTITIHQEMFSQSDVTAYLASYTTNQKSMSMQIMVPTSATPSAGFPVILMVRGYVDPAIYQTGIGTKNAARFFAGHGFVAIAPDFLGFGASDAPPVDTIESRLERPQQLQDLLASVKSLHFVDPDKIGVWGHSNGGQIALSLLEVINKPLPLVLWAPVTKPFPYSILYFADESEDGGKELRKVVANFENDYDVFDFTIDKYFERINGPIEIHQGTADAAVPLAWSDLFVKNMQEMNKDITYFTYQGADHDLRPAWQTAADRSLDFFIKQLYLK